MTSWRRCNANGAPSPTDDAAARPALLVTGGHGRLARLLRAAWRGREGPDVAWQSRTRPADLVWRPGAPLPSALPAATTVLALWGVTSANPAALCANADLAGAAHLLARACGADRVLHLSSAAVYGPGTDLSEPAPRCPANAYGRSKRDMEDAVNALPQDGITHCCLRLANIVGADSLAPGLRAPDTALCLDRFPDGSGPLRSYLAPGDLARIVIRLAGLGAEMLPARLNVAAPEPIAMADLARAAGRALTWRTAPPDAQQCVTLNTQRLHALLPELDLIDTAQAMIDDWRRLEGDG